MKTVGIIPVRLESSRLHQKAIADISGIPMFAHTYMRAKLSNSLDEVYLATDSEEIKKISENFNINTIMTDPKHRNSSERIAEACMDLDCEIVVNIQGDEPLLYPDHIDSIVAPLLEDSSIDVCMGITKFSKKNSYSDIKAAIDMNGHILYCSRNDIPFKNIANNEPLWKLVFIVPHRKECILKYLKWEQTPLEISEDNHFLRLLENGVKVKTVEVEDAKISVDTVDDLNEVRELMKSDELIKKYK